MMGSTSDQKILLLLPNHPAAVTEIAISLLPAGFALDVLLGKPAEDDLVNRLAESHYVLGSVWHPWSQRVYEAAASIKLIQLLSAGYDKLHLEELARLSVPVSNNGGANGVAVAEHAVMLILAIYRRLIVLDRLVRSGGWRSPNLGQLFELEGKLVGLVGLGTIGRQVARRLTAFDARVQYFDAYRLPPDQEAALGVSYVPLDGLLQTSDVVSLHVPLSPTTRRLIGPAQLNLMKPSAILINTCRGQVVDESALFEALSSGRLAGAGLDTLEEEPARPDNLLFSLDNVVITPHTAGTTWDSWPKRFANGYANIDRVARGKPPLWVLPGLRELQQTHDSAVQIP